MGRAATDGLLAQVAATRLEEPDFSSSKWYFSREEIEKFSPSQKDGIDSKKEAHYRRSYCTFLQELGMKLKMPQIAIATAIVFCHRFFLRQSHARNDRFMVATISIFLSGKVEETPRQAHDVVMVSYALRHKQQLTKEVYKRQLRLLLTGENLLLKTLGFDLNVSHPYRPMVLAVRKLDAASQSAIAQVAWNFINDGLKTTLFLQFKPHHIAAGAIFLGAKFLKIKLPSDGGGAWWRDFQVSPRQLEEVSNQMLELYEQAGSNPSRTIRPTASVDSAPSTQTEVHDAVSKKASSSPGEVISRKEPDLVEPPISFEQEKKEVESIDEAKLKAALKRRKSRVEPVVAQRKQDVVTDEELLERELENGIEAARPKRMENGDMHREATKQVASLKRQRPDTVAGKRDEVVVKRDRPDEEVVKREVAVKKERLEEVVIAKQERPDEAKERIDEAAAKIERPAEVTVKKERVDEVMIRREHPDDVLARPDEVVAKDDHPEEVVAKGRRSDETVAAPNRERPDEVLVKIERQEEVVVAKRDNPVVAKRDEATKVERPDETVAKNEEVVVKKELPNGVIETKDDAVVVKELPDEVMEKKEPVKEERPEAEVTAAKSDEKRERPDDEKPEGEPASKRKKLNGDELPPEPAAAKVEAPDEEEGELPSSGHDFPPRSPPRPLSRERRMVSPHERPRPPPPFVPFERYDRRREFHQYARRETFFDRQQQHQQHNAGFRHHRDYYAPQHQFQQHQQHFYQQPPPRQMDWQHHQQQHHHRPLPPPPPPREPWMERDAKKARYDSYK